MEILDIIGVFIAGGLFRLGDWSDSIGIDKEKYLP